MPGCQAHDPRQRRSAKPPDYDRMEGATTLTSVNGCAFEPGWRPAPLCQNACRLSAREQHHRVHVMLDREPQTPLVELESLSPHRQPRQLRQRRSAAAAEFRMAAAGLACWWPIRGSWERRRSVERAVRLHSNALRCWISPPAALQERSFPVIGVVSGFRRRTAIAVTVAAIAIGPPALCASNLLRRTPSTRARAKFSRLSASCTIGSPGSVSLDDEQVPPTALAMSGARQDP